MVFGLVVAYSCYVGLVRTSLVVLLRYFGLVLFIDVVDALIGWVDVGWFDRYKFLVGCFAGYLAGDVVVECVWLPVGYFRWCCANLFAVCSLTVVVCWLVIPLKLFMIGARFGWGLCWLVCSDVGGDLLFG